MKQEFFFVDSKTSAYSVGFSMARSMGIRTAKRTVFIDNDLTEEAIKAQIMRAVQVAKTYGEAVAIGHPYGAIAAVLKKALSGLKDDGVDLVFASAVLR